jgi:RHS repeat-associated protein
LAQIDTQKLQISDTLRIFEERVGAKNYELSNHLGNVLATISDKTIFNTDHYNGIVYSAQLYYPFGWEIPTLSYTAKKYRFGFNGKEDDREWHAQDYGFRLYTPRESRFISVDPITAEYPWYTPYQFAGNKPIAAVDLDGAEEKIVVYWLDMQGGTGSLYGDATLVNVTVESINTDVGYAATKIMWGNVKTGFVFLEAGSFYEKQAHENNGLMPSSAFDYNDPSDMEMREANNLQYLTNNGASRAAIAQRDRLAPEVRWDALDDASTALQAIVFPSLITPRSGNTIKYGDAYRHIPVYAIKKPVRGGLRGKQFEWVQNGIKYNVRVYSPDLTAPVGSNSHSGWTFRVSRENPNNALKGMKKTEYLAKDGKTWYSESVMDQFFKSSINVKGQPGVTQSVNLPNPHYVPGASNDTHIPIK